MFGFTCLARLVKQVKSPTCLVKQVGPQAVYGPSVRLFTTQLTY